MFSVTHAERYRREIKAQHWGWMQKIYEYQEIWQGNADYYRWIKLFFMASRMIAWYINLIFFILV